MCYQVAEVEALGIHLVESSPQQKLKVTAKAGQGFSQAGSKLSIERMDLNSNWWQYSKVSTSNQASHSVSQREECTHGATKKWT